MNRITDGGDSFRGTKIIKYLLKCKKAEYDDLFKYLKRSSVFLICLKVYLRFSPKRKAILKITPFKDTQKTCSWNYRTNTALQPYITDDFYVNIKTR
jgi:hypothetical protein